MDLRDALRRYLDARLAGDLVDDSTVIEYADALASAALKAVERS